jgi:hypothetical protein
MLGEAKRDGCLHCASRRYVVSSSPESEPFFVSCVRAQFNVQTTTYA